MHPRVFSLSRLALTSVAMYGLSVVSGFSQYTWISATSSSWDTAGSWSPSGPPPSGGDIVASLAGASVTTQIESGTRTINNISLTGQSFSVVGASTVTGTSHLQVNGSITKGGTGTLVFRDSTGALTVDVVGGVSLSGGNLRFGSNSTQGITALRIGGTTTMAGTTATGLTINMVNGATADLDWLTFTTNSSFSVRETTSAGTSGVKVTGLSGSTGIVQAIASNSGGGADSHAIFEIASVSSATFGGVIRNVSGTNLNTLALVKSGTGTQVLTNTNTYSGGTTITAGSLVITGTGSIGSGDLAIGEGAIFDISGLGASTYTHSAALAGEGTINAVGKTFTAAGAVTPGDNGGTGLLSVAGNLTLAPTAATTLTITGSSGGSFDSISVTGALVYGGGLSLNFDSLFTGDVDLFSFASSSGSFSSVALTGAYTGSLSLVGDIWSGDVSGNTFTFDQSTGMLSAVPEPGAIGLIGLGLAALLWRRRQTSRA